MSVAEQVYPELQHYLQAEGIRHKCNQPGSKFTTLAVGGPVAILIEPDNADQLGKVLKYLSEHTLTYAVLGAGSNCIIADSGLQKPLIRLGRPFRFYRKVNNEIAHESDRQSFAVGGAMPVMTLSRELCEEGYSGLEFAGGIPASFGGAVRINAGAHGCEFSSIIEEVSYVDRSGQARTVPARSMNFSYRSSSLAEGSLVYEGRISLKKGDPGSIAEKRRFFLDYRKSTQPLSLPSFGSVFKNPAGGASAGALIESCGLKGYTIGGARISEMHANWIVNENRTASARDVLDLIALAKHKVRESTGILLEEEVFIL